MSNPADQGLLVLMCGTAYSGKSTYAQALAARVDAVVVSLDEINERRGLWGGDGIPVEEWIRTHELARTEVRAQLAAGRTVIVDDTSSLRSLRDGWRSLAAGAGFVLVYLDVDHPTIRRRQAGNRRSLARGDVADAVLEQHLADFEPPGADESPVRVSSM
ncbi:ATP-binding protein [Kribbella pittospori]|uniref:ATP-binding protein n=1 Tax=Kribbella pittospori TaxID=722689 RepID=A0A4R0L3S9_9ACTN|nr:ATP-binding protein [Kribbella pittospori]TCC63325.1 ATP-binding protein [Kribbella pittospori]